MRACAVALIVATTVLHAGQAPAPVPADRPIARTDQNSVIAHAQLLEKARRGRIDLYFSGDSITRRWGATDYPDFLAHWTQRFFGWNAANFGWGADATQNILWRLQNGELDGVNPKVIVLLAGTNNVGSAPSTVSAADRAGDVSRGIRAILDVMRSKAPQATIVLTAIFPRNDDMAAMPVIDEINRRIARFADGRSIRFLNVNDRLADANGMLFDGMMGDRLHPTLKGYQVWADALEPILLELLGPRAADDRAPPPTGDPSKPAPAQPATAPAARAIAGRERISINDGWRFTKDDPPGTAATLLYDERPAIGDARDDRPADAEPEKAGAVRASVPTIKPWILPTANPFIKDPAKRHVRPAGNPGESVAYVRRELGRGLVPEAALDSGGRRREIDLPRRRRRDVLCDRGSTDSSSAAGPSATRRGASTSRRTSCLAA